jgi:hypothetical protein
LARTIAQFWSFLNRAPTVVKVGAAVIVILGATATTFGTAQTYVKLPARVDRIETSDAQQTRLLSYSVCMQEEKEHGHSAHPCKRLLSPEDKRLVEVDE